MTPAALSKFVKKVPRSTSVTSQPVKKVSSTKRSVNQPRSVRSHGVSDSACDRAPAKLSPGVPPRRPLRRVPDGGEDEPGAGEDGVVEAFEDLLRGPEGPLLDREDERAAEELPHQEEGREEKGVDEEREAPGPEARRGRGGALHEAASKPNSASWP